MGKPITAQPVAGTVAATPGIREALIEELSKHERQLFDPRMALTPRDDWPDPLPPHRDPIADMLDDLRAGKSVEVDSWRLRGISEVPPTVRRVRIAPDGTLSPAPR